MPQDSMFPHDDTYDGLRITWEQVSLPEGRAWNLEVRRKERQEGWQTVHVSRWSGVMMDLATTLQSDALHAFMYDGPRGLVKACTLVHKLARQHQRRYDQVRP